MTIQSISDIITNSSSEIFVIKTDDSEEVKELIKLVAKEHREAYNKDPEKNRKKTWEQLAEENLDGCSGDGGSINTYNWKEIYESRKSYDPEYTLEEFAEDDNLDVNNLDNYMWIDIDHSRRGTIKFICDNYEVVDQSY